MKSAEHYFRSEIIGCFDELMKGLAAQRLPPSNDLSVRYESPQWFVEFFALAEDGPKYCPRVEVGPLPEVGFMPRDKQVDIMHAIPQQSDVSHYNVLWRYSDPEHMRAVFSRVRDEIFIPFAIPLLNDSRSLLALVRQRSSEINQQWHEEIKKHNLSIIRSRARAAWQAKDYALFIKVVEAIPERDRTPLELRKISLARKAR